MATAELKKILSVDRAKLFAVVTKYEDYPQFVDGVSSVSVERKGPGKARVTYKVNLVKELTYTLDHEEDAENGFVKWSLVSGDIMKKNSGHWELRDAGAGKTEASYKVEVEFKVWVPGPILNKLVSGSLPSMIENFEKRARV